jgi:Phage tail assembly chaperone proteins, E, or 41 or 14
MAREGFVIDGVDVEANLSVEHPPHKPKVVYQAPKGPQIEERAPPLIEQPPAEKPGRAMAEPPAPIDLDAPPEEVKWPVTLKLLHKPTRNTKSEVIHELILQAPTAKDIRACGGNPVRLAVNGDVIVDDEKMLMMISRLSGVFPVFIESLDSRDFTSCSFFMQRFFLPNMQTWAPKETPS